MQIKHIFFLSAVLMNVNSFAIPIDENSNEFNSFKKAKEIFEAEEKQDYLVSQRYERLTIYGELSQGVTEAHVLKLIRVLLNGKDFIDNKYWKTNTRTRSIMSAIDETLDSFEIDSDNESLRKELKRNGNRILDEEVISSLEQILEKYTDIKFLEEEVYDKSTGDYNKRFKRLNRIVLLKVLLRDRTPYQGTPIDSTFWSETFPVNMVDVAIEKTSNKMARINKPLNKNDTEALRELIEHILTNARKIDSQGRLERFQRKFSKMPGYREVIQKSTRKVIDINSAINKAKR